MKIGKIKFENYTNLSGIELCFNLSCNFLVGENSIGKTNALRCINHIYNSQNFAEKDFFDKTKPIIIYIEFYSKEKYTNYKNKKFLVTVKQNLGEDLQYFSQDIFIDELKKELKILSLTNSVEIDEEILPKKLSSSYINLFNDLSIVKRAKKHMGIKEKIDLNNLNDNLYYSRFFILDILLKILDMLSRKKEENFEGVIIYSFPERNLHPFAQKTLVKDLMALANGQDEGFNRFIDRHFGIKKVSLQLFFKSHSDRILPNDYTKIIRFYRVNGKVDAVCGYNVYKALRGDYHIEKQLDMQFPYFSLAIFSRCVILIEGASEYGAMEEFAKTLNIDLDYLGISIISANGEGNIPALASLLRNFKIKVLTIRDRDNLYKQSSGDNFYTEKVDFEDEVVASLTPQEMLSVFEQADIDYKKADFTAQTLQRRNARYKVTNKKFTKSISFKDYFKTETDRIIFSLSLLYANKSVLTGKTIGKILKANQIPKVYKEVLMLAKEFASE